MKIKESIRNFVCSNKKESVWVIATIIFLLVVQVVYTIPAPCKWLDAVWGAGDFISLVGTLVLGFISMKQTKIANQMAEKANEMSRRLMNIEDERYKLERRPFVMVTDWEAYILPFYQITANPDQLYIVIGDLEKVDKCSNLWCLSLNFQNTTESFITVEYKGGECSSFKLGKGTFNQNNRKLRLAAGKQEKIVFYATEVVMCDLVGKSVKWEFYLENRFSERYLETFNMIVLQLCQKKDLHNNQLYCDVNISDFSIGKYIILDGTKKLQMEEL